MSQAQARAWWTEVEHLREEVERRRAGSGEELRLVGDPARQTAEPSVARSPAQRRTVKIRGQVIPTVPARQLHEADAAELAAVVVDGPWARAETRELTRRRPRKRASERVGPRPDRIALWAFVIGLLLVVIAAATAHGATPPPGGHLAIHVALAAR